MQILKGSKDRQPDYNPLAYSKGSDYSTQSLDRYAAIAKACRAVMNSRTEEEKEENRRKYLESRINNVNEIIHRYPPHFALKNEDFQDRFVVDIDGENIRWSAEALAIKTANFTDFHSWKASIDRAVYKHWCEANNIDPDAVFKEQDRTWHDILEEALTYWEAQINPPDDLTT